MTSVAKKDESWCKLSFEFDLNNSRSLFNNRSTSNHYNDFENYNGGYYSYDGLPRFIGQHGYTWQPAYNQDYRVGALVKFVQDEPTSEAHPNPNVNLIIHCLVLQKKTLEQLEPNKCLRVKVLVCIYEIKNEKTNIRHLFDQLSFRMASTNKYIEFKSLTDCKFLYEFKNYKLTVDLHIDCITGVDHSINRPLDLEKLISDPIHSDVELVVDGHTFKAHKVILAARCEYFKGMFSAEMKEQQDNRVEIEEVDKDVFKLFLEYIYTGKITENAAHLDKLLILADRFQAIDLKTAVADLMLDHLNVDNAVDYLSLAKTINHKELKAAALEFVCQHKNQI